MQLSLEAYRKGDLRALVTSYQGLQRSVQELTENHSSVQADLKECQDAEERNLSCSKKALTDSQERASTLQAELDEVSRKLALA